MCIKALSGDKLEIWKILSLILLFSWKLKGCGARGCLNHNSVLRVCRRCCEPSSVVIVVFILGLPSVVKVFPTTLFPLCLFSTQITLDCGPFSVLFFAIFSQEVTHPFHWAIRDVASEICLFPHPSHIAPCLPKPSF